MTWSVTLAWKVELTDTAKKQLAKLDKTQAQRITKYLRRVICELRDDELVIVAVMIGHRSEVYE